MSKDDRLAEKVLFVDRARLESEGALTHGFSEDVHDAYGLINREGSFLARSELEEDPSRKQAIPYVVVHDPAGRIFTLGRKSTQTEARLHGKLSFGVGGHIPDEIGGSDDKLEAGMRRELHEELHIPTSVRARFRGLLNDDTNAVGRVHLGVVFTCEAPPQDVKVRETDKMNGEWLTLAELREVEDRLESWSALLLPYVDSWTT